MNVRGWALLGALASGCAAGATPVDPHDASVAGHDRDARGSDAAAAQHAARVDPSAARTRSTCPGPRGGDGACWTWETNPTERHLAHADELRAAAEAHRVAGAALVDAERRSCAGISDGDRDMSPFDHDEDVVAVRPASTGRGTTIVLRPVAGLDLAYARKLVECHVARNAAMGFDAPEMAFCPLAVRGVQALVEPDPAGVAVTIHGADATAVAEIERRANALPRSAAR